jgi:hypothetical protein
VPGEQAPSAYPQQTLLPHEVKPGKSRKPLVIALVLALVLVVGGVVAWQLLKDNGESTRAAYCSALKSLTNNGDLTTALSGAGASTFGQVNKVVSLAPDAVKSDWTSLQSLATSAQSGNLGYSSALQALSALNAIATDAQSNCSITLNVPGLR